MPRANSSIPRHKRHRKIVKQAKGYYGVRKSNFKAAKDAVEISEELQISLSSTYKALTNLEKLSLVEIQRFKITDAGKKIKLYRSRVKKANISISKNTSEVTLYPNNWT